MIYRNFLKTYGIHLFDESPRNFSKYALDNGWDKWDKSDHRDWGLCCHKKTGQFHLFTTSIKIIGNLQWATYHLGVKMKLNDQGEYEKISQ